MTETETEQPKEYIIGETYMVNYIGWKKVKLMSIKNGKAVVKSDDGESFETSVNKIKINLL